MISQAHFKRIVERFIMPLVAGSRLTGCRGACHDYALQSPSAIKISLSPGKEKHYVMYLSRTQYFNENEVKLVHSVVSKWSKAFSSNSVKDSYVELIAGQCLVEAIVESIDPTCKKLLLGILDVMGDWSAQTYEGQRIAFAVGVDKNSGEDSKAEFLSFIDEDYVKVMTSGHDTLLVCNTKGNIINHESLFESGGKAQLPLEEESRYAPTAYIPLSEWSVGGRYSAALNESGEILLFKEGSLVFARRRGQWIFFTHFAYINGMGRKGQRLGARKALYQTMLDVSFKRTGGCLGLWHPRRMPGSDSINPADRLDLPESPNHSRKNRFLRSVIGGRKFQELPRKLRQELVSIDGATVLLYDGTVLAVGAILKIDGGSAGGGRTAAAMELAKNGVGVKISNDGKVTYWMDLFRRSDLLAERAPKYEIG